AVPRVLEPGDQLAVAVVLLRPADLLGLIPGGGAAERGDHLIDRGDRLGIGGGRVERGGGRLGGGGGASAAAGDDRRRERDGERGREDAGASHGRRTVQHKVAHQRRGGV